MAKVAIDSVAQACVLGLLGKGHIDVADAQFALERLKELAQPEPKLTPELVLERVAQGVYTPEEAGALLAKVGRKHGGGGAKRADTVLGYSATSVVRWMGVQGFGFKDARKVMDELCPNNTLSDSTIRCQLFGAKFAKGEKGYRGEPAPLTEEQTGVIDLAVLA